MRFSETQDMQEKCAAQTVTCHAAPTRTVAVQQ
jgi:hypothetical protein